MNNGTESDSSNQSSFGYDIEDLYDKLSNDNNNKDNIDRIASSTKRKTFPEILHELLQNNNDSETISWIIDGTAFLIKNRECFEQILIPIYFRGIKFQSFQRQLNIYGFERINTPNLYAYKHEFFIKDRPELIKNIKRVPVKMTG